MVLANHAYIAMALVDQGDRDGAREAIVAGGFEHGPGGPTVLRFAPWSRARLHELDGNLAAVRTDLQPLIDDEQAGTPMRALAWKPLLARTIAAQVTDGRGAGDEAVALAGEHLTWAEAWGRPAALGIARRAVALAAPSGQRAELMGDAVETLASSPLRTEEGRARAELGVALLRLGKRNDGQAELEAALEIAGGDRRSAAGGAHLERARGRRRGSQTAQLRRDDGLGATGRRACGRRKDQP